MSKTKSFLKQFVAAFNGDTTEVEAQKAYRQAKAALESQLNSLKGDLVDKEEALEQSKEELNLAYVNNGKKISDRTFYVQRLFEAKNNMTMKEEALDQHKEKIKFVEEAITFIDSEI